MSRPTRSLPVPPPPPLPAPVQPSVPAPTPTQASKTVQGSAVTGQSQDAQKNRFDKLYDQFKQGKISFSEFLAQLAAMGIKITYSANRKVARFEFGGKIYTVMSNQPLAPGLLNGGINGGTVGSSSSVSRDDVYDAEGYDKEGYDKNGYDREGYDKDGYNREGYDKEGYNRDGFNSKGFNREGYDKDGYNAQGYDIEGYNREGYDKEGYNRDGFNSKGFNREGYDKEGYNAQGLDKDGFDRNGHKTKTETAADGTVTESVFNKSNVCVERTVHRTDSKGIKSVEHKKYNPETGKIIARTVTYYYEDRTEENEYDVTLSKMLISARKVTYNDGRVLNSTYSYPDLQIDSDGKTILNPDDYTRVENCSNGDRNVMVLQGGVIVRTETYNKQTNKTTIYEYKDGKRVKRYIIDHNNSNTIQSCTFDAADKPVDNSAKIKNIKITASASGITVTLKGTDLYNGLYDLDRKYSTFFGITYRNCINKIATGNMGTNSISADLIDLAKPSNQASPNSHTKKIKVSKVFTKFPSDRADADKIRAVVNQDLANNGYGYTLDMLTGYLFDDSSEFCKTIKASDELKKFVKANINALKNGTYNGRLDFNTGDLYYALHGVNVVGSHMDSSGNLHLTLCDVYDFATADNLSNNSRNGDKLNAVGDALMKDGKWKPYYMIFDIVITAAELKAMGIK